MTAHAIEAPKSRYGAFSHIAFTVMWIATTCSLTGVAISDTASAWLMTNLNADPRAVTMVQAASSLSMFLFTIPAGALADMVAPRRYLLILESVITVLIGIFGFMVLADRVDAAILIVATFILSAFWSVAAPAWLSITPLLVPPRDLDSANAFNSVGYNISRALGPVLAGLALSALGPAAPYLIFAGADLMSVAALLWWRPPAHAETGRSSERLWACTMTGIRHAAANEDLKATLVRAVAVYPFACAYTALLPLVARNQMDLGPEFLRHLACGGERRRGDRLVAPRAAARALQPRSRGRAGHGWYRGGAASCSASPTSPFSQSSRRSSRARPGRSCSSAFMSPR